MVIIYLYDALNGYRYRKIGLAYYERSKNLPQILAAWIVPSTELEV
jgi:hypothetical protein